MKKLSPLLLTGFLINAVYTVFLSSGYLATFAAALESTVMQGVFLFIKYLAWASFGLQTLALLLVFFWPHKAVCLGIKGSIPYLPLSCTYLWGLTSQAYDTTYARFEKSMSPQKQGGHSAAYARGNTCFFVAALCIIAAIGVYFFPNLSLLTRICVGGAIVLLAANLFLLGKHTSNKLYINLLNDKLVLYPTPGKPYVLIPYSDIEKAEFADDKLYLTVRHGKKTQQLLISLQPILPEERVSTAINIRNALRQVVSANTIIA